MSNRSRLIARYRDFARAATGQSDCFTDWATGVAGDRAVRDWIVALPYAKQQPNLVFAAARWHGVAAPGPYAGLREALLSDDGAIRATIMTRATQTNEVGRLATLMPVLGLVDSDEPIALLEVGPSAGLCLYPDRYDYDWSPAGRLTGPGDGRLRGELSCAVSGPVPMPSTPPVIGWRGAFDLNPLDVTDDDAMDWLSVLVWPEQDERRDRLRTAITIARSDPSQLTTGDLLDRLPELIEQASPQGRVVVFHSAVIGYLDRPGRERFTAMMASFVAEGRCHWISNEDPRVLPEISASAGPAPTEPYFLLGLDGRPLAWSHQHGASLRWLS